LRSLADAGERAVMMLTTSGTLGDRIEGLRIGVDHYLPKPVHMLTPIGYRSAER
jgi:DNA-binding response OmpR family regulator